MEYVDFEWYAVEYGGDLDNDTFLKNAKKAFRKMDVYTTGIDGFKKLVDAFPDSGYDSKAVKLCACGLIDLMAQVDAEKKSAAMLSGVTVREDGTAHSNMVSSVSSGTESISYATGGSGSRSTAVSEAIKSINSENELYFTFINDALSGVSDKNGVNLLYMGRYPYRRV